MPSKAISGAIRTAAEKQGLRIEAFRRKHRLPNTPFYDLLRDALPAKVATRKEWKERLEAAGVAVNGNL